MNHLLVTGASGFVGRYAVAEFSRGAGPDDRIVGVGRTEPSDLPAGIAFRQVDIRDETALMALVAELRPKTVLHLAAMASVHQSTAMPGETWQSNIGGLINLADALSRHAAGCSVLFVSSGEIYGRAFRGSPVDETVEPRPIGCYSQTKWLGEQILKDILPKAGIKLVIARPFNHFGPGQDERFVLPSFAHQIARIEAGLIPPVLEVGNLDAERDFLPVEDVVRAYAMLIDRLDELPGESVFNIASGRARSIASVLDDLRRHARVSFEVRISPDRVRPSEVPVAVGDASRLQNAVGWAPAQDWDTMLARVLDHARETVRARIEGLQDGRSAAP